MMLARIRNGIARLKPGQVQALGTILGLILFVVLGTRRRVAFANLRLINPQWASKQVHRFTRKVFQHFGITLVETTQMDCLAPTELLRRIQVEGAEHVTEALEQGRGLIVISAHIGNWESALQLFPLYFKQPVLGVAKSFRFGFGHRWVEKLRTRTGNQVVPKKNAFVRLMQTLRQGGAIGLMMDTTRMKQGVSVRFMGHPVNANPAAALLAMRSKSAVLPMICTREPDGRLVLRISPAVTMRRTANLRADVQYNTQRMTDIIEAAVRSKPEQWYWLQKRWKSFYPELYPPS